MPFLITQEQLLRSAIIEHVLEVGRVGGHPPENLAHLTRARHDN
jgi:hypothetical protein